MKILYFMAALIAISTVFSIAAIAIQQMQCANHPTDACTTGVIGSWMQFMVSEATFWPNLFASLAAIPYIGTFLLLCALGLFILLAREGLA